MTIKQADQFMTDPLVNPTEEVLVTSEFLQRVLRERHQLTNELNSLRPRHDAQLKETTSLRHRLMIAESNQPYTRIIDTRA